MNRISHVVIFRNLLAVGIDYLHGEVVPVFKRGSLSADFQGFTLERLKGVAGSAGGPPQGAPVVPLLACTGGCARGTLERPQPVQDSTLGVGLEL